MPCGERDVPAPLCGVPSLPSEAARPRRALPRSLGGPEALATGHSGPWLESPRQAARREGKGVSVSVGVGVGVGVGVSGCVRGSRLLTSLGSPRKQPIHHSHPLAQTSRTTQAHHDVTQPGAGSALGRRFGPAERTRKCRPGAGGFRRQRGDPAKRGRYVAPPEGRTRSGPAPSWRERQPQTLRSRGQPRGTTPAWRWSGAAARTAAARV